MMKFQRFADLKASGLVGNWAQLRNLIRDHNFPPGRMLSPNVRAWSDAEIEQWLASRPQAGCGSAPPLRGGAKTRVEQARAKAEKAANRAKAAVTAAL